MRVIHVITRLIVGGAQENTVASVLGLHDRSGVAVKLLSGPTTGPEGSLENCFRDVPQIFAIVPPLIRAIAPWSDWCAYRMLKQIFRAELPDIVHTHSGKAGILGRLAARAAGVPIIVHTIHGPSFGNFQGALPNFVYRAAERFVGRFTDHFISVARAMSEQYLAAGIGRREQHSRIFSGFPLEPFLATRNDPEFRRQLGIGEHDIVVGKIARLFELKGHDDLVTIAPALVRSCPALKFLFVGDGLLREHLQTRVRQLGLERHFIFVGLVPPAEIPRYIGIMDMLVHLSRREGLPRALPQALAAGLPVVTFDCDGANEICLENETGFLVSPGNLSLLQEQLLRLARDPELRQRLGQRGRELVSERFPVRKMVDEIHALYVRLIDERLQRRRAPELAPPP
ncbi:MAG: glycosyltransferase family 4 protein [Verrucomicrobia bacterium]|nr:glycosyltransferase family 4 protein [Verrucomicrobiota bacterium]